MTKEKLALAEKIIALPGWDGIKNAKELCEMYDEARLVEIADNYMCEFSGTEYDGTVFELTKDQERDLMSAQARYDKKNTKVVTLKLNKKTDADILGWLEKQDSKQGAVKKVMRSLISGETHKNSKGLDLYSPTDEEILKWIDTEDYAEVRDILLRRLEKINEKAENLEEEFQNKMEDLQNAMDDALNEEKLRASDKLTEEENLKTFEEKLKARYDRDVENFQQRIKRSDDARRIKVERENLETIARFKFFGGILNYETSFYSSLSSLFIMDDENFDRSYTARNEEFEGDIKRYAEMSKVDYAIELTENALTMAGFTDDETKAIIGDKSEWYC